jgi:hypothetical protein
MDGSKECKARVCEGRVYLLVFCSPTIAVREKNKISYRQFTGKVATPVSEEEDSDIMYI